MPPALSDEEMYDDGPDMISANGKIHTREQEAQAAEEDDNDEEEDSEEYRVEKVLNHRFDGNERLYQIKWLGYDEKEDLTWEPLDNLHVHSNPQNAKEALDEYHKKVGGVPEPPAKEKGTRSAFAAFDSPAAEASGMKRGRKSEVNGTAPKVDLPVGSWEAYIQKVTAIIEDDEVKGKRGNHLLALVEWVSGSKTKHKVEVVRCKCPQKLLDYYEQHLVFRNGGQANEDE